MEKVFFTADELSAICGVKRPTLYKWAREGKLPRCKIGKKVLFPVTETLKKLKEGNSHGKN